MKKCMILMLLLLSIRSACADGQIDLENFLFDFSETEAALVAYDGEDTLVTIPDTAYGRPVTMIADGAFAGVTEMEMVVIPEGICNLGEEAFAGCENLRTVVLPDTLQAIGDRCFAGCRELTDFTIPDGCSVSTSAFDADVIPLSLVQQGYESELHRSGREESHTITITRPVRRFWYWGRPHYRWRGGRRRWWPRGWRWNWGAPLWGNITRDVVPQPAVTQNTDGTVTVLETEIGYFGLMCVRLVIEDERILSAEAYEHNTELEDGIQELYEEIADRLIGYDMNRLRTLRINEIRRDMLSDIATENGVEQSISSLLKAAKKAVKATGGNIK